VTDSDSESNPDLLGQGRQARIGSRLGDSGASVEIAAPAAPHEAELVNKAETDIIGMHTHAACQFHGETDRTETTPPLAPRGAKPQGDPSQDNSFDPSDGRSDGGSDVLGDSGVLGGSVMLGGSEMLGGSGQVPRSLFVANAMPTHQDETMPRSLTLNSGSVSIPASVAPNGGRGGVHRRHVDPE